MKRSAPMKRSTMLRAKPVERRRSPALVVPAEPPKLRSVMAAIDSRPTPLPKLVTYVNPAWLAAVGSIKVCMRCGRGDLGVQVAHRNEGKGKGLKVHDCWTAALCPPCHFEIDQGKDMTRDQRRAEIDRCIVRTIFHLVMERKVGLL